jgi:lysophospholipase L1-like esterase
LLGAVAPLALLGALEGALQLLVPRIEALSRLSNAYVFQAFEDQAQTDPIQKEGSAWRKLGFVEKDGLRFYPPIDAPGMHVNALGLRAREFDNAKAGGSRIALLGGSTIWGTHVTDAHTVGTYLEEILNGRGGGRVRVDNLGVEGATFESELKLLKLLSASQRFDVAVFYHGGNDFMKALGAEARQGGPLGLAKPMLPTIFYRLETVRLLEGWLLTSFERKPAKAIPFANSAALGQAVSRHLALLAEARDFCKAGNMRCLFLLQPMVFSKRDLLAWERVVEANFELTYPSGPGLYAAFASGILAGAGGEVQDLRGVFDDADQPVFGDMIHVNAFGNRLIAKRIAQALF